MKTENNKSKSETTQHSKDPNINNTNGHSLSYAYVIDTIDFPIVLINELDKINFKKQKSRRYAEKLLRVFLNELKKRNINHNDFYLELSSNYIIKLTSTQFYKEYFLKVLKADLKETKDFQNKIIQSNSSYSTGAVGKTFCKKYRINPNFLVGETKELQIEVPIESMNHIFPEAINHFMTSADLITKKISKREMFEKVIKKSDEFSLVHVSEEYSIISKDGFKENVQEEDNVVVHKPYERHFKISKLKSEIEFDRDRMKNPKVKLIAITSTKTKTKYVLGEPENVLKETKEEFQKKCYAKLSSILRKEFNPIVSASNGRFNNVFTSLNNFCIDFFLIEQEEISSFDLKSAQPTILANLFVENEILKKSLMNTRNPKLLKYLTETKELFFKLDRKTRDIFLKTDVYEALAKTCSINRNQAKVEILKILFSEPGFHSKELTAFNELYPEFGMQLNEIKKAFKNQYNSSKENFSKLLQLIEAFIFIENIYIEVSKANIPAITKHDSILFAKSRKTEIEYIIKRCFSDLNFNGIMVYETPSPP